jgi:hypothetical protein
MENVLEVLYNLINDINKTRNDMNTFFYTSNLIVGDMMAVDNGNIIFYDPVTILNTNDIYPNPNLSALLVMGGVYIKKNLLVNGNIVCGNDLDINGGLNVGKYISGSGNAIFGNVELNTISNVGILMANSVISNMISGNIGILNISNSANIKTLTSSNVEILNIFTFRGNNISFNTINITNEIIGSNVISNNIVVNQNIIGSNLTANNTGIINNLNVKNDGIITGNATINGNLMVIGNLELSNEIIAKGNIYVYGFANLIGANVRLSGPLYSNSDLFVSGNISCLNITSIGVINSNINTNIVANMVFYSNLNNNQFNGNIQFMKQNRNCTIRLYDNINGKIINQRTKYIYANLENLSTYGIEPNIFIPNTNIIRNNSIITGNNVGYCYIGSGNIDNVQHIFNIFYPDFVVGNNGGIRIERFDRNDFYIGNVVNFDKFSFSFLS